MAGKSSVVVRFLGDTTSLDRAAARASAALGEVENRSKRFSNSMNAVGTATVAGVAAIGVAAVKMGIDWQREMTTLQTGAGESKANIDLVSHGLLTMAGTVGTSATELAHGMYMVESAGFHGAAGLKVLQAAAEGAKVGNADMATVANAVTSALNSYHLKASDAARVTNMLIATVANGKMKMDDLAGALGNVLPVAATAKISLAEVGGALSTMTMQGVDANTAATFLRQTISKLQAPTHAQANEFRSLGLDAVDVSSKMGQRGLVGTLTLMTDAITKKMGPSGLVTIESLKKMAAHTTNFQKALIKLPPAQQTYVAALAAMMGGTKTLQGALLLSGTNMKTFAGNTKAIGAAAREGGGQIKGWTDVTADLSVQIDRVREGVKAWLTELGMQLIPILQNVIGFVGQHSDVAKKLATVLVGVLALTVAWRVATLAIAGVQAVARAATLAWAGAQWLLNAALDANPIGVIILAIAALVAAVVFAYNHVDWFRKGVDVSLALVRAAFSWLVNAAQVAFGWIKDHLALVALAFGPVGIAVALLGSHWSSIWNGIQTVVQAVWKVLQPIFSAMSTVVGGIVGGIGKVASVVSGAVGGLGHLLGFADGGTVPGATGAPRLAVVHGGEYVVSNAMQAGRKPAMGLNLGGAGGGHTIIVNNYHPTDTGQSVSHGLRQGAFLLGMTA